MIILQANWDCGSLHAWALEPLQSDNGDPNSPERPGESLTARAVAPESLRGRLGDVWDSLLVQEASVSQLTLRLPHRGSSIWLAPAHETGAGTSQQPSPPIQFQRAVIETLSFSITDAVDFLMGHGAHVRGELTCGDSFRYWQNVARFVLELLAQQRYIPSIERASGGHYRGVWHVIVDEDGVAERLRRLIDVMPHVCRASADPDDTFFASALVESFIGQAADALVRRCLYGDEMAHALLDTPVWEAPGSSLWLRSLIAPDALMQGDPSRHTQVHATVMSWLDRLKPPAPPRTVQTCLRIQPPDAPAANHDRQRSSEWTLTVHARSIRRPRRVLDPQEILGGRRAQEPVLLPRPLDDALDQVRRDLRRAAHRVPLLAPLAAEDGPLHMTLTTGQAYSFLRNDAPILESDELVIWPPEWWNDSRPRLRMSLHLRPVGESSSQRSMMGVESLVEYDWRVALGDDELSREELDKLADTSAPLVFLKGRWSDVRSADVREALAFLQENRGGQTTLFEALRWLYVADDLATGLPVNDVKAYGWIDEFLSGASADAAIEFETQPARFHGELRPYQLKGMAWLRFLSRLGMGACLADDMGLGKTIQLIALILCEQDADAATGPTLLVVPTSLVGNWQRELARFAPSLRVLVHHGLERLSGDEFVRAVACHDVVISTYSLTHRDFDHLSAVQWHRVTLDEAQNIKNPSAKQTRAIRSLRAIQRVALTGTPVENRLAELWSILEFLNPGYLGTSSDFRRRFAVPIERNRDTDRAQRLRHLIQPFVLRRLKSDPKIEAELPQKMEMKVYCNLTREQAGLYETVVREMLSQIDQSDGIQRRGQILKALIRLKQICNHPEQVHAEGGPLAHRSGKCDRLTEMLEEVVAEGDSALVFTQFRIMGDLLKRLIEESLGREALFLHGGTPRLQRDQMVERFQTRTGQTPVFILSLKAGGFGLNLTAANHVFHFDRWWNPAVEDQATDRAHRIGQTRRVQVHKFICAGTLEERIDGILTQKRSLAERIVGTGEEWLTELSTGQLREMFALAKDAVAED